MRIQYASDLHLEFRENWRVLRENGPDFYALKSIGNPLAGEEFINEHFKELQGKLFRPYEDRDIYTLALERPEIGSTADDNAYRLLSEFFIIEPITLGENPKENLDTKVADYKALHPAMPISFLRRERGQRTSRCLSSTVNTIPSSKGPYSASSLLISAVIESCLTYYHSR